MGNTPASGLEQNFCREITKEDMMMLRVELTTEDPSRALKLLGLEAFHMPYFEEVNVNSAGQRWKSYHDLVGEIDDSTPASRAWRCVLVCVWGGVCVCVPRVTCLSSRRQWPRGVVLANTCTYKES